MKVCKFGGTSLANADQIRKVCDIILSDPKRRVIVVSAPGKRHPEDSKVTDLLIDLAAALIEGKQGISESKAVIDRFRAISREMNLEIDIVKELELDLHTRIQATSSQPERLMDSLKSLGEDTCAKLLAAYLKAQGIEAHYIDPLQAGLVVSDTPGDASVLPISYKNLAKLKEKTGLLIFPGFFGYTEKGQVVTFSRGGSDITGSILAAALGVEIYENWTDVDNVFVANPHLVEAPQALKEISYSEMRELAYGGFSVIHEEALAPAFNQKVRVNIRNTNNPYAHGTWIVPERENFEGIITGIGGSKGFSTLYIYKYLMNKETGFTLSVLQILEDLHIPFEHMPSGMDSLSVVIKDVYLDEVKRELLLSKIKEELHPDQCYLDRGLAIVIIVGDAMAQTVGVMARATSALSRAGINIELINQGVSEISALFGVRQEFFQLAIKELYREFFLR